MPRPCARAHPEPIPLSCYICWLAVNVKSYQRKWGLPETGEHDYPPNKLPKITILNEPLPISSPFTIVQNGMRYTLPCIHEGAVLEWCNTCNGEMRHVRECDIYDKCTRGYVSQKVKACVHCAKQSDTPYKTEQQETSKPIRQLPTQSAQPISKIGNNMELNNRRLLIKKYRDEERIRQQKMQESNPLAGIQTPQRLNINPNNVLVFLKEKPKNMIWECGVTTVPLRRTTTLPKTIQSLTIAGFPTPQLFIDVQSDKENLSILPDLIKEYITAFGSPFSFRFPNIKTFGNFFLALMEMIIRNPFADRYVLFQDDIVACDNLREYLEYVQYPEKGYLNLITYPQNETEKRKYFPSGIPEEKNVGWYRSNQMGKGAQGLVFDKKAVITLLRSEYLLNRPLSHNGHENIDGGINAALKKEGFTEYVHSPSLIRHIGAETTIYTPDGKGNNLHPKTQPSDLSFRGELFNALLLLKKD